MTRQRKSEETYCNCVNFKWAVDSKTDINQIGVQIIKNLSRIEVLQSVNNISVIVEVLESVNNISVKVEVLESVNNFSVIVEVLQSVNNFSVIVEVLEWVNNFFCHRWKF